jgi:TolA-binding protein
MNRTMKTLFLICGLASMVSCEKWDQLEAKAERINRYENVSLHLARENRDLKAEMTRLRSDIQTLKSEKNYLQIKLDKYEQKTAAASPKADRKIASVAPVKPQNDLVKFDVYKWTPTQVLSMAEKEFENKNFEKSAQFFTSFRENFPSHEEIDDHFLFQAGVAAFESGDHPEWTLHHLETLVKAYPTSQYYRGAKLWMALTYLQLGDEQKFFTTVEEFRKKYRNTEEWKVLSPHYEKIVQKFKKN